MNKKTAMYIVITVFLVVVVAIGTIFVLDAVNSQKTSKTKIVETKVTADDIKTKAINALKNEDKIIAKSEFLEYRQQYIDLETTDKKSIEQFDNDVRLYLIENSKNSPESALQK